MLSRRAFTRRIENSHRADDWKRCEPFLQWLRGRPCFISLQDSSHKCWGKVRACHFDPWGKSAETHHQGKGMGTKVADQAAMPMCDGAHSEQHNIGWQTFQRKYQFDGRDVVTAYWTEWLDGTPMGAKWKLKQEAVR
jgi:hypothetical protein